MWQNDNNFIVLLYIQQVKAQNMQKFKQDCALCGSYVTEFQAFPHLFVYDYTTV